MFQHYFCLAAFLWMSVLAYDLWESTKSFRQRISFHIYKLKLIKYPYVLLTLGMFVTEYDLSLLFESISK